jgi:molecular chaperone DnaJ
MNDKNYYEILGVAETASTEEIRKAFQQKARKLHPDVNKAPDAEERFKEVSEAYAVLSDDEKRARYDAMRRGVPFAQGQNQSQGYGGYGSPFDPFGAWGFGGTPTGRSRGARQGRYARYKPEPGADIVFNLEITNEMAKKGGTRGFTYQRYVTCATCEGAGNIHQEAPKTCPTCHGTGRIAVDMGELFGGMSFGAVEFACPECEGSGRVVDDPCTTCHGTGRVLTADEVVVTIPAGAHDGDEIRLVGRGNAGTNGETTGDLVVKLVVPEERLAPKSAFGFQMIGFALPFVVFGLVFQVLSSIVFIVGIPLVFGLFCVATGGFSTNPVWWKNALRQLAVGAMNGLVMALFVTLLVSCTQSMGRSGLRGF